MKPTSMNETDRLIMNQLCKVCGEPAAGYHFGAFTCEGCKSFFGRTYNNLSALGECKNNGECVINKKNRTSCKSCRLKKCLMVGMSKSGSRYGRRSNWFKIHCLIQDQQEMSNRMAEQGLVAPSEKNGSPDVDLKISDPKDFLAKYKENELRNSSAVVNNLNELTAAAAAAVVQNNVNNNNSHSHRISPRLATSPSTTNSDGSLGSYRSVSSAFHTGLFDSAKMANAFTNPYLPAAAAAAAAQQQQQQQVPNLPFNANDFQKELNNLASRFNPGTIPFAPISPLNAAAVSRLFLQNSPAASAISALGRRFNELQKLQNEQLNQAACRLFNPTTLQQATSRQQSGNNMAISKDSVEEMTNGVREIYGDPLEQDGPIDLSVKRLSDYKELSLTSATAEIMSKCSQKIPGDHDSGFSPSSNEDNHNTSPLDLTSSTNNNINNKRPCLSSIRCNIGSGGRSASMMLMKNNCNKNNGKHISTILSTNNKTTVNMDDEDEDEDEDVDVDDVEVGVGDDDGGDGDDETSDVEVNDDVDDDDDDMDGRNSLDHHRKTNNKKRSSGQKDSTMNISNATTNVNTSNNNNNSHRHEIPCSP